MVAEEELMLAVYNTFTCLILSVLASMCYMETRLASKEITIITVQTAKMSRSQSLSVHISHQEGVCLESRKLCMGG
jgi:hypothetical protein